MPRRWYQTIEIDGLDVVFEDINRKDSKFWNEGKWNNFVKPLLPKEQNTFLEIGCNAGLFLKMAADEGFRNIIGVEQSSSIMKQAELFKESNNADYKLIQQHVGSSFDLDQIPLSDVVLISNAHYYLTIPAFAKLVDDLRNHSLYCIIVSARAKRRSGKALWNLDSVRGYFRDWQEITTIENLDDESDISYRPQMYSVLFKGNLVALDVNSFYDTWAEAARSWKHRSHDLPPALEDFYSRVLSGESLDPIEDLLIYKYWRKRKPNDPGWALKWIARKEILAKDIQENGIKIPIYFIKDRQHLRDGLSRICIAKLLGQKHILGKLI